MYSPYAIEIRSAYPKKPSKPRIAFIGEAPGKEEVEKGRPFVGRSGKKLDMWLREAGLKRHRVLISNVFMQRPENNKIDKFFIRPELAKEQEIETWARLGISPNNGLPFREYRPHFYRLRKRLHKYQSKIVFAVGRTAFWALVGNYALSYNLGERFEPKPFWKADFSVIPIYHPAYILRNHDRELESKIIQSIANVQA